MPRVFRRSFFPFILLTAATVSVARAQPAVPVQCDRLIVANVAALEQPIYFNRLGANLPGGQVYALQSDIVSTDAPAGRSCADANASCKVGKVALRPDKRPRPMVLRANVGDCLQINFTNYIDSAVTNLKPGQGGTRNAGIHITGMELVSNISDDSSFVGKNPDSLANAASSGSAPNKRTYTYYAKADGTFLMYSFDDGDPGQWASGLFGGVTVQPPQAEWYRSQVTRDDLQRATYNANRLPSNMTLQQKFDANKQPTKANVNGVERNVYTLTTVQTEPEADRHTTTVALVWVCSAGDDCLAGNIYTLSGHPVVQYDAIGANGKPVLGMLNPVHLPRRQRGASDVPRGEIQYGDLTAMITGPYADRFPYNQDGPEFHNNPALPDRRQPYREFSVFYHVNNEITQAFAEYYPGPNSQAAIARTVANGNDSFAINYGTGGIGSEILANRLGVGPEKDCVECKFEEFFLSSWAVGDPAMVVTPGAAKAAKYPDDPSNVYHSYLRDHVKFRIYNASPTQQHVHHQHAHQWLHTNNDDGSTYLDSQMIIPGAAYTLDMVYNGSGNRNGTIGDSIFHCHFYPHFAAGMWSLWRVHDVFESGTKMQASSLQMQVPRPVQCSPTDNNCWNRALPDGEIEAGTPIPAVVPMPTLGMAPLPANVKLVDGGKRAYVQPEASPSGSAGTMKFTEPNAVLRYQNPGYPFFVPGVAGHRAPHPPLDFAWQIDRTGKPVLDANGNKIPLDGGLPRHLVLGGQFVREFHTVLDFSKDFKSPPPDAEGPDKEVLGTLFAAQLPEEGTAVEQAAMSAQSQRTTPTYTPDGQPGNFTRSGLPPVPGAPFAPPDVDDNGNDVNNTRVYRAAVVQRDVVLNKAGWHYPQQRFLTLWNDVDPTMDGTRPPQPLFFRANTGETVEYWHTNLVPSYYALDDFQVRTPTDIIGQHIHLVKFDVMASDGAANGFNYEDGTFSPDEVRERIEVIDNTGTAAKGMYNYSPSCWGSPTPLAPCLQAGPQTPLTAKTVAQSGYPFTDNTPGQRWTGAQTTIQRWDTDPLLDNEGRDRTMRTVFTHDHFGPSTHQQVGLYAGLVIEPDNSRWFDSQTGAQMYTRPDGGPTSWAAVIQAANPAASYREFMLEYQDSQFAYTNQSLAAPKAPPQSKFPIGNVASVLTNQNTWNTCMKWVATNSCPVGEGTSTLNTQSCPTACCVMQRNFCSNGIALTSQATLSGSSPSWTISDHAGAVTYAITGPNPLQVAVNNLPPAWYDTTHAINPQLAGLAPAPPAPPGTGVVNIISSTDSGATPGTFSVNYRNEPLPLRVTAPGQSDFHPRTQASDEAGDLSFAFASVQRADPKINVQPDDGQANGTGRTFPNCPLSPTQLVDSTDAKCSDAAIRNWAPACANNGTCVQPTDPYTPMMRAFEGDRVQIRTLAGAHVRTHPIMVRGLKWLTEPSAENSGYRNTQPSGLSEHFEFLFRVPFSGKPSSMTHAADYLYQASASLSGTSNGLWGLLRAYDPSQSPVGLMKLPAEATRVAQTAPNACPADLNPNQRVSYSVVATNGKNLPRNALIFNTRDIVGHTFQTPGPGAAWTFTGGNNNPDAIIYALEENLPKLASGALGAEPLILRAKAGDCITITLKNGLPSVLPRPFVVTSQNPTPSWLAPYGATNGFNPDYKLPNPSKDPPRPLFPPLKLATSTHVGLSPQLVSYDVTENAAFNIGFNHHQSVPALQNQPPPGMAPDCNQNPSPCKTYTWYAGDLEVRDGKTVGVPLELGAINLLPSDPLLQEPLGLYGALIIEPKDSSWTTDGGTQAAATVTRTVTGADGVATKESFREFVVIAQDDGIVNKTLTLKPGGTLRSTATATATSRVTSTDGRTATARTATATAKSQAPKASVSTNQLGNRLPLAQVSGGTNLTINSINYRTETIDARYTTSGWSMDLSRFFSNQQVGGQDPQTPIFTAPANSNVRFRMLRPGQDDDVVMAVHGHAWQEQPFTNSSREMGYNPLSNWFGTQQLGANDKIELLTGRAGGRFGVPGDYLFHGVLQAANPQNLGGMWGLMRATSDGVTITDVHFDPAGPGNRSGTLSVSGVVTKAATSAMATAVTVYKMTDLDAGCAPDVRPCLQKLGEAAVNADGSWAYKHAGVTLEEGAAIRVISNLAVPWPGQATVDVPHAPSKKVITTGGGSH